MTLLLFFILGRRQHARPTALINDISREGNTFVQWLAASTLVTVAEYIVDHDDELAVEYTVDGKRGTVPRAVLLLEPIDGMVVSAQSMALESDQHMEDHKENSNNNESDNSSSGSGRSEHPSADGSSTPAKLEKFKKKASKGSNADDSDSSDARPPLKKKVKPQSKHKAKKVTRALTLGCWADCAG